MNLLKALFSSEVEEADFFETTYPLVNNFLNTSQSNLPSLSDVMAVVKAEITPGQLGRVQFQGVRWRACCDRDFTIPDQTQVRVLGRRSNILVVEPVTACVLG